MKDFSIIDYVFSPGASSVGYVDFIGATDFDITRVVAIINQTKGVVIYATGSTDTRYTSISDKRVFLFFDTSTHSASDKLQIVYNSKKALTTSDSEGNELILFAVATTNTEDFFSDSQVINVARTLFVVPLSPLDSIPANALSISSIHKTQGEIASDN